MSNGLTEIERLSFVGPHPDWVKPDERAGGARHEPERERGI